MAELTPELRQCYPATGPIAAYVEWISRLSFVRPEMHLASIAPVFGYELCRRGFYLPTRKRPRLWCAIVSRPGAGKTFAVDSAREFSEAFYRRLSVPFRPWLSMGDSSAEGFAHEVMTNHTDPRTGITTGIFEHTEFASVLRSKMLAIVNKLYDGRLARHLRHLQRAAAEGDAGNTRNDVQDICFNGVVGTTTIAIEAAMRELGTVELIEGGFFSRFCWLLPGPPKPEEIHSRPQFDDLGRERVSLQWWSWWCALENASHGGHPSNRSICFEPAAEACYESYFARHRSAIAHGDASTPGIALRVTEAAQTLAAIYASSRGSFNGSTLIVTEDDMQRASCFADRWEADALKLSQPLTIDVSSLDKQFERFMRHIREAAMQGQGIARSEMYGKFGSKLTGSQLTVLRDMAVDQGLIVSAKAASTGGREAEMLYAADLYARLTSRNTGQT